MDTGTYQFRSGGPPEVDTPELSGLLLPLLEYILTLASILDEHLRHALTFCNNVGLDAFPITFFTLVENLSSGHPYLGRLKRRKSPCGDDQRRVETRIIWSGSLHIVLFLQLAKNTRDVIVIMSLYEDQEQHIHHKKICSKKEQQRSNNYNKIKSSLENFQKRISKFFGKLPNSLRKTIRTQLETSSLETRNSYASPIGTKIS